MGLFGRMFGARAIGAEAKATIASGLTPRDPRLVGYFSGEPTDAGESVTVDGALQINVVWACVRLIAQTIATLPLDLYRPDRNGDAQLADDHPLYTLIHDQPNADMTAVEFWEALVGSLLLWGNGYSEIVSGGAGIVALNSMRPDRLTRRWTQNGDVQFVYSWGGEYRELSREQVLHIKGFSTDGFLGLSPVAQARNSLASSRAADRAAGAIFRNGMRLGSVLVAPNYLNEPQRSDARKMIEAYSGAINTGKTALLEGGWDIKTLGIPPEDAQMLETRSFNVEEICRWFDVPPVMIGHMEKSTAWGTGLEQMMLWFLTFTLRAHLKRIEQAIGKHLLTPAEKAQGIYAKFNVEALLRADSAARAAFYSTMANNGIMNRNEIRAKENLPPMPGGDVLTVQSALLPITDLGLVAKLPREKPVTAGADVVPPPGGAKRAMVEAKRQLDEILRIGREDGVEVKAYDSSEPRDDHGQWSSVGGGAPAHVVTEHGQYGHRDVIGVYANPAKADSAANTQDVRNENQGNAGNETQIHEVTPPEVMTVGSRVHVLVSDHPQSGLQVHGLYSDPKAAKTQQEAMLRQAWASNGRPLNEDDVAAGGPLEKTLDSSLELWNHIHGTDVTPESFSWDDPFGKWFYGKYIAGQKEPYPGANASAEYLQEQGLGHLAVTRHSTVLK
jgi:HK97 family phage portal protein